MTGTQLPDGRQLSLQMTRFFASQRSVVLGYLRAGKTAKALALQAWTPEMAKVTGETVAGYWQRGLDGTARRIEKRTGKKFRASSFVCDAPSSAHLSAVENYLANTRFKARPQPKAPATPQPFSVHVQRAAYGLALDFCQATNDTSVLRLQKALGLLRQELSEGAGENESLRNLTRRVKQIFDDPQRAFVIAVTESSRAYHGGQLMAAEESGVVKGLRWLATSAACPICQTLNGKVVKLGEDFVVEAGGGTYASVKHPPRHPHCTCTCTEVI